MEDLNKTQIVLLTLLVSFVTSIATGIVTVSLLDQAPVGVTQTINRVVEKTVQTVVPQKLQPQIVTKEVPIKSEDLIVSAVDANTKSMVRISGSYDSSASLYEGLGFIISKSGFIITPAVSDPNKKFTATTSSGKTFPLIFLETPNKKISLFKTDIGTEKYTFTPATLADSNNLKLGQSVISFGGTESRNIVGVGVISGITLSSDDKKLPILIETNLNSSDGASGFFLLNLDGSVIGLYLSPDFSVPKNDYIPINLIKDQIPSA